MAKIAKTTPIPAKVGMSIIRPHKIRNIAKSKKPILCVKAILTSSFVI